jgi:long-subunit fatty acid transport protein
MQSAVSSDQLSVLRRWVLTGVTLFLLHCSLFSVGQGLGNTPYSVYGIGEIYNPAFSAQQAMGSSGVSYANGIFINNLNPALLVRNRVTVFEVGLIGQVKRLRNAQQSQQEVGGGLNYLAMAFPVNRRWTTGLTFRPYSYVNYEVRRVEPIQGTLNFAEYLYKGSGGVNQVAWTNGFQIGKSFYAGLQASFLFGNIARESGTTTLLYDDANGDGIVDPDYRVALEERYNHRDLALKAGIAYRQKLKDKLFLNVGAAYEVPASLRTGRDRFFQTYSGLDSLSGTQDVLSSSTGAVRLPGGLRVGASLENPYKLAISADFSYQPWSQYRGFGGGSGAAEGYQDAYQVAVGAEYTPNILSATDYLKRLPYRVGFNYGQTPYLVNGNSVRDLSFTLGTSLPLNRQGLADLSLGLQFGQRGTLNNGGLREQYFRVNLGFTIGEQWFYRQVVD